MADLVALTNIALRRVGVQPIASLTEGTPQASSAKDLIPVIRDSMLTEHTWRFAKKQVELAQSVTAPEYGYTFAYILPGDALLVTHMKEEVVYSVMNIGDKKVLITDAESAVVTYRARVENDALWDPYFRDAFCFRLAAELALAVNENETMYDKMMGMHSTIIEAAITVDSIEPTDIKIISPTVLVDARHSGFGTWGSDFDHKIKLP